MEVLSIVGISITILVWLYGLLTMKEPYGRGTTNRTDYWNVFIVGIIWPILLLLVIVFGFLLIWEQFKDD